MQNKGLLTIRTDENLFIYIYYSLLLLFILIVSGSLPPIPPSKSPQSPTPPKPQTPPLPTTPQINTTPGKTVP